MNRRVGCMFVAVWAACSEPNPSGLGTGLGGGPNGNGANEDGNGERRVEPRIVQAFVRYAGAPSPDRNAAGDGERIEVRCVLDAEVTVAAATPVLEARNGAAVLPFELTEPARDPAGQASVLDFEVVVDARMHPNGVYVPRLEVASDGERYTLSFAEPAIRVATGAPQLQVAQDEVAFLRSPVGNDAPERFGPYRLAATQNFGALVPGDGRVESPVIPGDALRFEDGRRLTRIQVWSDREATRELASAVPDANGDWPRRSLEFGIADDSVTRIFVTGEDGTGGRSPSIPIETSWYVASSAPARTFQSPHRVILSPAVDVEPAIDPEAQRRTRTPDAESAIQEATGQWVSEDGGTFPERPFLEAVWHETRGTVIAHANEVTSRLIEFVDGRWVEVQLESPGGPPPLDGPAMAYDSSRDRIVLHGGLVSGASPRRYHLQTWEWDGQRWLDRTDPDTVPRGRSLPAMVYADTEQAVFMYGGDNNTDPLGDLWSWDGTRWSFVDDSGPPRTDPAIAWDSSRRSLWVFDGTPKTSNAIWEWDGASWRERTGLSPAPQVELGGTSSLLYDPLRSNVVLVKARRFSNLPLSVWTWDGQQWRSEGEFPDVAHARSAATVWDGSRLVMVGGQDVADGLSTIRRLWFWDGSAWSASAEPPSDGPQTEGRWVHDVDRDRFVFFGATNDIDARTFEFSRSDGWTEFPATDEGPSSRASQAMAYDSRRGRVVMFGGRISLTAEFLNDTWAWSDGAWVDLDAGGPFPRAEAAMAFDPVRSEVVLLGGAASFGMPTLSDTWTFDGLDWSQSADSAEGPGPWLQPLAVYDSQRSEVWVVGGSRGGTWSWDGVRWVDREVASPNFPLAAGFDDQRGRIQLLLRPSLPGGPTAVAEWNGSRWSPRTLGSVLPDSASAGRAVYDQIRRQFLYRSFQGSVWSLVLDGLPTARLQVDLPADITRDQMRGLTVRAWCVGDAGRVPSPEPGAALSARTGDTWRQLGRNSAGMDAVEADPAGRLIVYSTEDPAQARQFWSGTGPDVRCEPLGTHGGAGSPAQVGLDYLEVRVKLSTGEGD